MGSCGQLEQVPFVAQYGDEAQRKVYAERVGVANAGKKMGIGSASLEKLITNCLSANRIIYCKQSPGDCGQATRPQPNRTAQVLSLGSSGLGIVSGIIGTSTTAGAALGAATGGLGLLMIPIFAIFGHHAQAVRTEQDTLCKVSLAWEGFALGVETYLPSGEIGIDDARQQLQAAHMQLSGALQSIEKQCNAACGYRKVLDALKIWNDEVVFPSLSPGVKRFVPAAAGVAAAVVAGKVLRVF